MKPNIEGTRVIRGPDWNEGESDGGEGHLGTVQGSPNDGTVNVLWDVGHESEYRAGRNNKYDLRIFDTGTVGVFHENTCASCGEIHVYGMLWRCQQCPDLNICSHCYAADKHDIRHPFQRIDFPGLPGKLVKKRKISVKIRTSGFFPGAKVTRGKHWTWDDQDGGAGNEGEVEEIINEPNKCGKRNLVKVKWPTGKSNIYRLAFKGFVDLTCTDEEAGGFYYRDHLPFLDVFDFSTSNQTETMSTREITGVQFSSADAKHTVPRNEETSASGMEISALELEECSATEAGDDHTTTEDTVQGLPVDQSMPTSSICYPHTENCPEDSGDVTQSCASNHLPGECAEDKSVEPPNSSACQSQQTGFDEEPISIQLLSEENTGTERQERGRFVDKEVERPQVAGREAKSQEKSVVFFPKQDKAAESIDREETDNGLLAECRPEDYTRTLRSNETLQREANEEYSSAVTIEKIIEQSPGCFNSDSKSDSSDILMNALQHEASESHELINPSLIAPGETSGQLSSEKLRKSYEMRGAEQSGPTDVSEWTRSEWSFMMTEFKEDRAEDQSFPTETTEGRQRESMQQCSAQDPSSEPRWQTKGGARQRDPNMDVRPKVRNFSLGTASLGPRSKELTPFKDAEEVDVSHRGPNQLEKCVDARNHPHVSAALGIPQRHQILQREPAKRTDWMKASDQIVETKTIITGAGKVGAVLSQGAPFQWDVDPTPTDDKQLTTSATSISMKQRMDQPKANFAERYSTDSISAFITHDELDGMAGAAAAVDKPNANSVVAKPTFDYSEPANFFEEGKLVSMTGENGRDNVFASRKHGFSVGDKAAISVPQETLRELQTGYGGVTHTLLREIGKQGVVAKVDQPPGTVALRLSKIVFRINPDALIKIHPSEVGDTVRISEDLYLLNVVNQSVCWTPPMDLTVGKVGEISKVYSNGYLKVSFGKMSFRYSPVSCLPAPGSPLDIVDFSDFHSDMTGAIGGADTHLLAGLLSEHGGGGGGRKHVLNLAQLGGFGDRLLEQIGGSGALIEQLKSRVEGSSSDSSLQEGRLHKAILAGDVSKVKDLCRRNRHLVNGTHNGVTPLMLATKKGSRKVIQTLISLGADVNATGHYRQTALIFALDEKKEDMAMLLLDNGASISQRNGKGRTPLHAALYSKQNEAAQLLLHMGADINVQDKYGDSPIHDAISSNNDVMVDLLLQQEGINLRLVNNKGFTPLHLVCRLEKTELIGLLLAMDSSVVNQLRHNDFSPLHLCVSNSYSQGVSLLVSNGNADVNLPTGVKKMTPLHLACLQSSKEIVDLLLGLGANVNVQDMDGLTPLHVAMGGNDGRSFSTDSRAADVRTRLQISETLITQGAFVDVEDYQGRKPTCCGHTEVKSGVQSFIDRNMHLVIFKSDRGFSPSESAESQMPSSMTSLDDTTMPCSMCDRQCDVILRPCGHRTVCHSCMMTIQFCPSCGTELSNRFRHGSQSAEDGFSTTGVTSPLIHTASQEDELNFPVIGKIVPAPRHHVQTSSYESSGGLSMDGLDLVLPLKSIESTDVEKNQTLNFEGSLLVSSQGQSPVSGACNRMSPLLPGPELGERFTATEAGRDTEAELSKLQGSGSSKRLSPEPQNFTSVSSLSAIPKFKGIETDRRVESQASSSDILLTKDIEDMLSWSKVEGQLTVHDSAYKEGSRVENMSWMPVCQQNPPERKSKQDPSVASPDHHSVKQFLHADKSLSFPIKNDDHMKPDLRSWPLCSGETGQMEFGEDIARGRTCESRSLTSMDHSTLMDSMTSSTHKPLLDNGRLERSFGTQDSVRDPIGSNTTQIAMKSEQHDLVRKNSQHERPKEPLKSSLSEQCESASFQERKQNFQTDGSALHQPSLHTGAKKFGICSKVSDSCSNIDVPSVDSFPLVVKETEADQPGQGKYPSIVSAEHPGVERPLSNRNQRNETGAALTTDSVLSIQHIPADKEDYQASKLSQVSHNDVKSFFKSCDLDFQRQNAELTDPIESSVTRQTNPIGTSSFLPTAPPKTNILRLRAESLMVDNRQKLGTLSEVSDKPPIIGQMQGGVKPDEIRLSVDDGDTLRVDDRVVIKVSEKKLEELQQGFGGVTEIMLQCLGKTGIVTELTQWGSVRVRFGSVRYRFNPQTLLRVPVLNVGHKVRVTTDRELVRLVNRHVGFSSGIEQTFGKVGVITSVDEDFSVTVRFGASSFRYSPACCTLTPGAKLDTLRDESSDLTAGIVANRNNDFKEDERMNDDTSFVHNLAKKSSDDSDLHHLLLSQDKVFSSSISRLFCAISDDNLPLVRSMCRDEPALVNMFHEDQKLTTLMFASWMGRTRIVEELLDMGADVNGTIPGYVSYDSRFALLAALETGNEDTAILLVKRGADPNSRAGRSSRSALHMAVSKDLPRIVGVLVQRGADVNAQDRSGDTPLMDAMLLKKPRDPAIVNILLSAENLDVSIVNKRGLTMLHAACARSRPRVVEEILARDTHQVNLLEAGGSAPLHLAARDDCVETIRMLVMIGGADVNIRSGVQHSGDRPLHDAALKAHLPSVEALLELGANVNVFNDNLDTPLHYAMGGAMPRRVSGQAAELYLQEERVRTACTLISNGAYVDVENVKGRTCTRYGSSATIAAVLGFIEHNPHLVHRKQETEEAVRSSTDCLLCMCNALEVTLLPCGHKAVCGSCSLTISVCPMCQHRVDSTTTDDRKGALFKAIT